jgi:hypothetical protein
MSPPNTRKRKASTELSTNPHTVKAQAREAKMEGVELQLKKAKKADQAAITYALKNLRNTKEWMDADEAKQAEMKQASQDQVIHKRYVLCITFIVIFIVITLQQGRRQALDCP